MPSTADYLDSLVARGIIGGDALERTMTHWPEEPNPAQPYLDTARRAAGIASEFIPGYGRGLQGVADRQGVDMPMPDWMRSNAVQRTLQDPEFNAALEAAFWKNPAMAARADALREAGYGLQYIADDLNIGKASVGRYFNQSGQKTAAAENPSFWDTPGVEEGVKADLVNGLSHRQVAAKWGTTHGNISTKVGQWRAAGELSDDQLRPSSQSKSVLADPVKRADIIRLAKEGESQGNIASYVYGGASVGHGGHPRRGDISRLIRQLQEEGTPEEREALKNYAPQGSTGLTPAGKTPSLPQVKSLQGSAPDESAGQDWVKALKAAGLLKD